MEPDIKAYIAVMEEIKRRMEVVSTLQARKIDLMYRAIRVEFMVLQVRMITELVALASLAANKSIFQQHKKKFEKHWYPKDILKDVESLNPNFYPKPIAQVPVNDTRTEIVLVETETGFMTRDELIEVHGRCGNLLHARNPFGKDADYDYYENIVPTWLKRIAKLLGSHRIKLLNKDRFYWVWMKDAKDGRVHMQPLELGAKVDVHPDTLASIKRKRWE